MRIIRRCGWAGGFSLIELLFVVAIIGILAAMFLPVVARARAHAQRIACVNDLRQMGMAFHSFAHDHNSRFPTQVPMAEGGALEYAQSAQRLEREFYFSFRFFQALSNELVTPKVLCCQADTRRPASAWPVFGNSNLSYFVGMNAEFAKPNAILAGDRNITNDWAGAVSVLRLGPSDFLHWTAELHQFKGNVLFADGGVEEWNSPRLSAARVQFPSVARLVVPSVRQAGSSSVVGSLATPGLLSGGVGGMLRDQSNLPTPTIDTKPPPGPVGAGLTRPATISGSTVPVPATEPRPTTGSMDSIAIPTNAVTGFAPSALATPSTVTVGGPGKLLLELLKDIIWWFYLILVLLLLGALAIRWYTRRQAMVRAKTQATDPERVWPTRSGPI